MQEVFSRTSGFSRRSFLQAFSLPMLSSFVPPLSDTSDLAKLATLLKQSEPLTWVFAGDSVTQGAHHTYNARCYSEIIAERIRWELRRTSDIVINSGVNGTNTGYLRDNFDWYVSRFRPAAVSIMYGINDCQEPSLTTILFGSFLEEMIERIRHLNALPMIQLPNGIDMEGVQAMKTASRARLPEYIAVMREVAQKKRCIIVDHWQYWNEQPMDLMRSWLDDPLHPNAKGHLQMACLFFRCTNTFDANALTCSQK